MILDLLLGIPVILFSFFGLVEPVMPDGDSVGESGWRFSRSWSAWSVFVAGTGLFGLGVYLRDDPSGSALRYGGVIVASLISPAFAGLAGRFLP